MLCVYVLSLRSTQWESTEPQRNTFTFAKGDAIANLARANKQMLRCHTLVWHQQLPSWVTSGNFNNATLVSILKSHITNVVTHYKGQCYAWDVVNEALNEDGSYRDSVFLKTIGPAYIPIAFAAAAAADPNSKLYYNDYNIENDYGTKVASIPNSILSVNDNDGVGGSDSSGNSSDSNAANNRNKIEATKRIVQMIRVNDLTAQILLPF
jgi:endo-1,4-beta-xylanase